MAIFCTECGCELRNGTVFCTQCGTKAAQTAPDSRETHRETPVPHPAPQRNAPSAPQYTAPSAPQHAPVSQPAAAVPVDKTVSTGAFFGLMFLFALPVLGWLICLIVAFAAKNKNIKHFARAILIWLVIGLVLSALLSLAINTLIRSVTPYLEQALGGLGGIGSSGGPGELTEVIEQFGSLGDMMGQLEGMVPVE